jgi:hypothetical protein
MHDIYSLSLGILKEIPMKKFKKKSSLKRTTYSKEWRVLRLRSLEATECQYCPNWFGDNSLRCRTHLGKRRKDNSNKTWKKYRHKQWR